ncbi:hypothetical protein B0A55_09988 [Friedmanniomyces simplex]|uniref:Uncharacterized protein n=1 Tax=Friedmanniomyces simplex TaxID=329884 RepID=A0A4V5ND56_9PEZI|nr:hypothetical protein B0A55_09988 [Friedmanniomyces simplex]
MLATGHPALVLKNLTIAKDQPWNRPGIPVWSGSETPHDLTPIRASIASALEAMYSSTSLDLASYTEHNLVPGLAQFLLSTSPAFRWRFDPDCASALQFITGATKFYEVWLNGRFMAYDARSEVQAERERVAWEGSEAEVDLEPVVLADVRVVGSTEKWHGCGLRMGQFWTEM